MLPRIKHVRHLGEYRLGLTFADGTSGEIDFRERILGRGGVFQALQDIEFFKRVKANTAPGAPIPPVATTDGINFDRAPLPEERESLLAYLRKL